MNLPASQAARKRGLRLAFARGPVGGEKACFSSGFEGKKAEDLFDGAGVYQVKRRGLLLLVCCWKYLSSQYLT
jgi:hypothetical protein